MKKKHLEIKLGGFGGQGIILGGYIIGKAASIFDKRNATLTQSYGPESRGSACSAQLIISDDEVDYPEVHQPEILIIMSKEANEKFTPLLKKKGILLFDEDMVESYPKVDESIHVYSIPATRMAEEMGKKIVANIIMLGFFTAITCEISKKAMKKAVETSTPRGTEEMNLQAFEKGYVFGEQKIGMMKHG